MSQPNPQGPYDQQPYQQQPYQQQYGQQQYGQPYGYAPAAPTNSMAVVALIAGIAGLTLVPFIGSIIAVICGPIARRQIAETGEQGGGMATAGIVTGWIGIGLAVLGVLLAILLPLLIVATAGASGY